MAIIYWVVPILSIKVNSSISSLFMADHSSDSMLECESFNINRKFVSKFYFQTSNGASISVLKVSSIDSLRNKGTIIFSHGIRRSKEIFYPLASFYSRLGFDCFSMDMRYHGESEGNCVTYGHLERGDLKELIDFIENKWGIKGKLILWGQSLGAAVSLLVAAEDSRVDGVVSESSFGKFENVAEEYFRLMAGFNFKPAKNVIVKRVVTLTGLDPETVSPSLAAKRINIPVMIVHGGRDDKINPSNAYVIYSALKNRMSSILILQNASHLDIWVSGGDLYFGRIYKFIETL
jgi:pimeloyl-ACP methyl ester carboxylesterase